MNKREFYGILDDFSKAYGVTIELIEILVIVGYLDINYQISGTTS